MAIEAGPEYLINDAWGGKHWKRFSTMSNIVFDDKFIIMIWPDEHIVINREEHARLKSVVNHSKRPKS